MTPRIESRIAALERACLRAENLTLSAYKVSQKSDRKKYAFADGLKNDLRRTRTALQHLVGDTNLCTFGSLYRYTQGQIANLNQVLRNLKRAGEIDFEPECFFDGIHNECSIEVLDYFWKEAYRVDETNVFRAQTMEIYIQPEDRRGRSYEAEDAKTRHAHTCHACSKPVHVEDRITIRAKVFHLGCLSCVVCGASPRQKKDYVTFDGQICCSSACIQRYNGAHVRQERVDKLNV